MSSCGGAVWQMLNELMWSRCVGDAQIYMKSGKWD